MRTLDRYIARTFLAACLLIMAVLAVLLSLFELIAQLEDVGRGGYGLGSALLFAAYYNVSAIAKKLVAQGAIGVLPGVFWGQILLLVCLLLLNGRWLARWRRS